MPTVTAQQVAALRAATGAGVMDARRALEDANGDAAAAGKLLHERGVAKAGKKSGKDVEQGRVHSYVHDGRIGVLIELRCESDFVARNDVFVALANDLCLHIVAHEPADVDALLAQPFVRDESVTVKDVRDAAIARLGENVQIARFTRYVLGVDLA
jgi:elongation factor Ts